MIWNPHELTKASGSLVQSVVVLFANECLYDFGKVSVTFLDYSECQAGEHVCHLLSMERQWVG